MNRGNKIDTGIIPSGLAKCHFFYGPRIQTNWMELNTLFLQYVASKFSQSTKTSLIAETLVVTEVDSSKLLRFKTKEEKEEYLDKLEF